MNPYQQLVAEYARLSRQGKKYPLGDENAGVKNALHVQKADSVGAPVALICSPHPDDEVITGALPLRLLRTASWQVVCLAITLGSQQKRRQERLVELSKCCQYIGFALKTASENGLDEVNLDCREKKPDLWKTSVMTLAKVFSQTNPRVLIFPHSGDWNSTHIGTHFLVMDALASMPYNFSCYLVETEFWAAMEAPNLMVELNAQDLGDLVTALSFHKGEVKRNPYHLSLPAWMIDNVRRGSELLGNQGADAAGCTFATLYRLRKWACGKVQDAIEGNRILLQEENPENLFACLK